MIGASTIPVSVLRTSGKDGMSLNATAVSLTLLTVYPSAVTLALVAPDSTETGGTIRFNVSLPSLTSLQFASEVLHHAEHDVLTLSNAISTSSLGEKSTNATPATGKDVTQNLARILHSLDKFAGLGAGIAEVSIMEVLLPLQLMMHY